MRYLKINKVILIFLISFMPGIFGGCAVIISNVPAPPNLTDKTKLADHYDEKIPKKFVNQLQWASLASDWAIPYIFVNVGSYFEMMGDEKIALLYFDRAIAELQNRKDFYGEGTAISKKIHALYELGRNEEAYNAIVEMEKSWTEAPLNSFVFFNYGHYYLMNGNYDKALESFRKSFESNKNYQDDFNLLMLRRDLELEYGIALILADYYKIVSKKYNLQDFEEAGLEAIRKNIAESIVHLNQVKALNI